MNSKNDKLTLLPTHQNICCIVASDVSVRDIMNIANEDNTSITNSATSNDNTNIANEDNTSITNSATSIAVNNNSDDATTISVSNNNTNTTSESTTANTELNINPSYYYVYDGLKVCILRLLFKYYDY